MLYVMYIKKENMIQSLTVFKQVRQTRMDYRLNKRLMEVTKMYEMNC